MDLDELSALHRRYVEASSRFRAGWVFNQFYQSLRKVFNLGAPVSDSAAFQRLYVDLKQVAQGLTAPDVEQTRERLELIEQRLGTMILALIEEDSRIRPSRVRKFFRKFRRYDTKILLQLVRFYVHACSKAGWDQDRIDKLDFLLTRLAEEGPDGGSAIHLGRERALEVFKGLWNLTGEEGADADRVEWARREASLLQGELAAITTLDELSERGLLRRYRTLKHGLGPLLLEPRILPSLLETNGSFRNVVERFYDEEERRIAGDYKKISDLEEEAGGDSGLHQALSDLHEEYGRFEERRQDEEFRLDDLAQIGRRLRSLVPRLQGAEVEPEIEDDSTVDSETGAEDRAADAEVEALPAPKPDPARSVATNLKTEVAEAFERIVEALSQADPRAPASKVGASPSMRAFRLEPREVVAHRRLLAGGEIDRAWERFLLETAAVRLCLQSEAGAIQGLSKGDRRNREQPVYQKSRRLLRLADEYRWRFEHAIHQLLHSERSGDSPRLVQLLQLRLLRDYSALWLLTYRPFLSQGEET